MSETCTTSTSATTLAAPAPSAPDLTLIFQHTVERQIDPEGVYPHVFLWRDAEGKLHVQFLDTDTDGAFEKAHQAIEIRGATEAVFGIDNYAKPGDDLKYADFVAVYHWRKGQPWRYGVLEYTFGPPRIAEPIRWNHAVMTPRMRGEHRHWASRHRPLTITTRNADGTVDLHGLEGIREPRGTRETSEAGKEVSRASAI